jgi:hypothetical protein
MVWKAWMLDLSLIESAAVLAICLLSPVEIHSIATVTSDSAAFAAGAAVVATHLLSRRSSESSWCERYERAVYFLSVLRFQRSQSSINLSPVSSEPKGFSCVLGTTGPGAAETGAILRAC